MDAPENEVNPFLLPSDEEVFYLREKERKIANEKRAKLKKMKIWEKTTQASRLATTKSIKSHLPQETLNLNKVGTQKSTTGNWEDDAMALGKERRGEKESMSEFVAKKREMFLVQMALDTKREEIRKLVTKAKQKEDTLAQSEKSLEKDTLDFDKFLKKNDLKARDAIKKAEAEAKKKNQKIQDIKKLKQRIQVSQSEISKLKEQLDLCQQYREFLDSLTPPEHYKEQHRLKRLRQEKRRKKRFKQKQEAWHQRRKALEEEAAEKEEAERARLARAGKILRRRESIRDQYLQQLPPEPTEEDEELTDSGDDLAMFFTEPQQLLDIFADLELQNLFLIQNSQETEQALEELKQNYEETKKQMDDKTSSLKENIQELKHQIEAENTKAEMLQQRAKASEGKEVQEKLLQELNEKVRTVYVECGFESDAKPTTLTMLTDLEGKLEFLLAEMETMDKEYVEGAEKAKDKERRERVRAIRIKEAQEEYEARLLRSMERAAAPVKKKTGKPVMFRSVLKTKKKKKKHNREEEAKRAQQLRYFET